MKYLHYYKTKSTFPSDYYGEKYTEPWLSLVKSEDGPTKSFTGEVNVDDTFSIICDFEYICDYDDNGSMLYYFANAPVYYGIISSVDTTNNTITVNGNTFTYGGSSNIPDKYEWHYETENVVGTESVESIDGMVEFQGEQYSACTVNGMAFIMVSSYDGKWLWDGVDLERNLYKSHYFEADHETLTVGDTVEMRDYINFMAITDTETPSVGDEAMYWTPGWGDYLEISTPTLIPGRSYMSDWGFLTVLSSEIEPGEPLNMVNYNKTENERLLGKPLTFEITGAGILYFINYGIPLKYKLNDNDWVMVSPGSFSSPGELNVVSGDTVQFIGYESMATYDRIAVSFKDSTCGFRLSGNIMSLYFNDDFPEHLDYSDVRILFDEGYGLFQECTGLTDASNLILPATALTEACYGGMFAYCTSLTTAPELPATSLASDCYYEMFAGCTSLTKAPELPATTLANSCYYGMFQGCTSLTTTPELPATTLVNLCYAYMFNGCDSLTSAPELPATTLAEQCYTRMFAYTSLTTAPELPATTLDIYCYEGMFYGCTSLTAAPELPATTLAGRCYEEMFAKCTSLTTAPELPAMTLANHCYSSMFSLCTSLTTPPALPTTTLVMSCYSNMFAGCTSLTTAPELPAITLTGGCYTQMFSGCTSLNYIKAMFTTTPTTSNTSNWVAGVASSGTFVKNSAAQWSVTGVHGVPTGWTIETATS